MAEYDAVFSAASQLPADDQFRLIDELWTAKPSPLSAEWLAEIARRSAELDAGQVTTVPWEVVRANALRRAGLSDAD